MDVAGEATSRRSYHKTSDILVKMHYFIYKANKLKSEYMYLYSVLIVITGCGSMSGLRDDLCVEKMRRRCSLWCEHMHRRGQSIERLASGFKSFRHYCFQGVAQSIFLYFQSSANPLEIYCWQSKSGFLYELAIQFKSNKLDCSPDWPIQQPLNYFNSFCADLSRTRALFHKLI